MRRDLPLAEHQSSVTANVSEGGKAASRDARKDANPGTGIRAQTHRLTGSATLRRFLLAHDAEYFMSRYCGKPRGGNGWIDPRALLGRALRTIGSPSRAGIKSERCRLG